MEPSENRAGAKGMRTKLDRMLNRHFERITGTRNGIHGLPLTLTTVACIVLLADREAELLQEENTEPRYNPAELEHELEEMGLGQNDSLDAFIPWLKENGYVEKDAEGRLVAAKPTTSMAHLLEHAFPGMPGLNLVAYFIQTLEEVESARKPPEDALSQLDQTLRRHSAAPFRKSAPPSSAHAARSGTKSRARSIPARRTPSSSGPTFVSPIRLKSPASKTPSMPSESAGPARAVSDEDAFPPLQENAAPEEPPAMDSIEGASRSAPETVPDASLEAASDPLRDPSVSMEESGTDGRVSSEDSFTPMPPFEGLQRQEEEEEEAGASEHNVAAPPEIPPPETPPSASTGQDSSETGTEDIVEERIAAFEEKLALQCPVCRQAFVEEKKTATGKTYYTCMDEQCVFISWGRPHHVECPRCSNPFLVESTSPTGEIVLKCPRATCRHKQPLHPGPEEGTVKNAQPGPGNGKPRKKRVVRRKRVRKKR